MVLSTSRRSQPLPRNWPSLRARVLQRDGYRCTWVTDNVRCPEPATDVDHHVPASQGGGDEEANLVSLCSWHHKKKTGREAQAARPRAKRRAERHPGLR